MITKNYKKIVAANYKIFHKVFNRRLCLKIQYFSLRPISNFGNFNNLFNFLFSLWTYLIYPYILKTHSHFSFIIQVFSENHLMLADPLPRNTLYWHTCIWWTYTHPYILPHNWSLQPFSQNYDLVSHTTNLIMCVNF